MVPYKPLPNDARGIEMQEFAAPYKAIATLASENATASSVITLNDNTTTIEVGATGAAAVIKWIATSDTAASVISAAGTADYDNIIPANMVRRFAVPIESFVKQSSIVGLNKQYGLYNRVAVKSVGTASVVTIQF